MNKIRSKNQRIEVVGRSLILNIFSIILNLAAVFMIVKGFHESTTDYALIYKVAGIGILLVSLVVLIMLKGIYLFSYVARALVGGLFIVSGLVKANDPWGFAFKLEEYFSSNGLAFDYPFFGAFEPYVLELSILICVAEIVLGAAVILGAKIKLTSWLLVFMMAFFTWLTYYTFSCNDMQTLAMETGLVFERQCVTDCGCFGDALRGSVGRSLTPIESFWKDIVLFYFGIIIFVNQWRIQLNSVKENWIMVATSLIVVAFFCWVFGWILPIFFTLIALLGAFVVGSLNLGKLTKEWKMAIYIVFVSFIFSLYTSMYLPVKDYRPYAIGNNIKEQMDMGVPEVAEFMFEYTNKKTGKGELFAAADYAIYGDTTLYVYKDRVKTIITAGVDAPIMDFLARINYTDLKEEDKRIPYIDSLIKADFETYYENKLVLKSEWGYDTIAAQEYDTLYYPDSVYTKQNDFVGLIDPNYQFALDVTNYLLTEEYLFLMTIRDIRSVKASHIEEFKELYVKAAEKGIPFFVLSPATQGEIENFKKTFEFEPTFLAFDGIEVKIIVRSNPGLVLLHRGTVLNKWPNRSVEDFEDIYKNYIHVKEN